MPPFQPEKIFGTLVRHQVEFVTIGGIAATLHGSNLRTGDVDICPSQDRENLERLARAFRDMDARIRSEAVPDGLPFSIDTELLAKVELLNLSTRFGDFDLSFKPAGTSGYEDLVARKVDFDLEGLIVPVSALEDVIRSKEAAGRQKDREELPTLRALLAEIRARNKRT